MIGTMPPARRSQHGYPRRNLHGQIVHTIGKKILRGDLRPGDPIPVLRELPASRTAVREAIKVLAAKGLVEARPKIGTRVRSREAWNLLDPDVLAWRQDGVSPLRFVRTVTELRGIIEPGAATLAALRATEATRAAIYQAYCDMDAAVPVDRPMNVDAFVDADTRFHTAILRAAGNDILEQLSHLVSVALRASFEVTTRIPGSARATLPRHKAVLDAITAGRAAAAGSAMRRLVRSIDKMIDELPDKPDKPPRERAQPREHDGDRAGASPNSRPWKFPRSSRNAR
jgi:DNA-binding FadR family transcriptional regulator